MKLQRLVISLGLLVLFAAFAACRRPTSAADTARPASPGIDSAAPADTLDVYRKVPSVAAIPNDELGVSMRRGLALLTFTRDSLPRNVGNKLQCISCHPDGGRRPNGMPWVGVYARFPQYRSRAGRVITLEDRINNCFERSLNGKALDPLSREMHDMVAYLAFLSRGIPVGKDIPGEGVPKLSVTSGDTATGKVLFAGECARCHGQGGEGTAIAPPLWGNASYNIGAGMSRVRTAASFIRYNMPFDKPGTLTEQQAFDVAVYINARPRPDFPGKERDWPNGDPPPDVAYQTTAARHKADSLHRQARH